MTAIKQENDETQTIVVGYTQSQIDVLPAIIGKREIARIARLSERTTAPSYRVSLSRRIGACVRSASPWPPGSTEKRYDEDEDTAKARTRELADKRLDESVAK